MHNQYQGEVCGRNSRVIFGWAWKQDEHNKHVHVEILLDGEPLGSVMANLFDPSLLDMKIGDGFHAFAYEIPSSYFAIGKTITAKIANVDFQLGGTVSIIDNDEQQEPTIFTSSLSYDGQLSLKGQFYNPLQPRQNYIIQCLSNNQLLSSTNTISEAPYYGHFSFTLPSTLADGVTHDIQVKTESGIALPGSPIKVYVEPSILPQLLKSLESEAQEYNDITNTPSYKIMQELGNNAQKRYPNSLDFSFYNDWFERFQSRAPNPLPANDKSILHIIINATSHASLQKTISSILEQTSSNWRVYVQADVTDYFNDDTRFALSLPSANTLGHNDFITHINAGDHLPIYAVEEALHAFTQANDIGVIYTDSDCDNAQGQRTEPWFKPSWDLELFLSQDYIQHLCVIRAPFVTEIDWSPYTFIWGGISNAINNKFTIKHLPLVLYHYGIESKSKRETTPLDIAHKYAQLLSPKVQLKQHPKYNYLRQVRFPIPDSPPLVSIIIPTKDHEQLLKACISSIENNTDYTSFELIIIDNQTTDKAALEFLTDCEMKGHKVIRYNKTFNYSAINNLAIQQANGELIALLNNDIEVISSNWLCELVSLLHRPNVGAAGAKLIWPNELVQHGGVVLGINQLANHIGNHDHMDSAGYHGMLQSTHRTDAVTAACLLTRKSDYLKVGGLDEKLFPVAFNDVDYCLKLAEINLDCIWSPNAQLFHVESITRGKDDIPSKRARSEMEMQNLRNNWSDQLLKDKYYHPALSLNHLNAPYEALAYPPRERKLR